MLGHHLYLPISLRLFFPYILTSLYFFFFLYRVLKQGCGSANRFSDCSTKKKIHKNCFHLVSGHVAPRCQRWYIIWLNTKFVLHLLQEI